MVITHPCYGCLFQFSFSGKETLFEVVRSRREKTSVVTEVDDKCRNFFLFLARFLIVSTEIRKKKKRKEKKRKK